VSRYNTEREHVIDLMLDIFYNMKWERMINSNARYDKNLPLLEKLSIAQLYHCIDILDGMVNANTYELYEKISKKFRKKLPFPIEIDYDKNKHLYVYNTHHKDHDKIKPYSGILDGFNDDRDKLLEAFNKYVEDKNFIGADVARKYIQFNTVNKKINVEYRKLVIQHPEYTRLKIKFVTMPHYVYKEKRLDTDLMSI